MKYTALLPLLAASALLLTPAVSAQTTPTSGTLYYTTFNGGTNVHKVDFAFNGTSLTLSNQTGITHTPGADGLVFTSDHQLAVGGQGGAVYKVDPTTGGVTTQSSGNTSAFHMMADPSGTIWSSGIPGTPAYYNSTLTTGGTAVPVHYANGAGGLLDSLTWTTSSTSSAFYTSSGAGGYGEFGKVDLSTGLMTPIYSNLDAAHGMTYDAYSGKLVLFGDSHIAQIDPNASSGYAMTDAYINGGGSWDQGTSDGKGHLFVANNGGDLLFMDISTSKSVAAADFSQMQFLDYNLDDVAPLSGAGSRNVPDEGPGLMVLSLTFVGVLMAHRRRRRAA